MIDTEAFSEFKQALALLREHDPVRALAHIRRASELEPQNPYYLSYLGLALARAEHKWAEAERLCDTAVRMKRNQAQLNLNLAEVYVSAGRREDAVETLAMGLKYARRDPRLNRALGKLGMRRPPVLRFLGRKNFFNRQLGKLRHQALKHIQEA